MPKAVVERLKDLIESFEDHDNPDATTLNDPVVREDDLLVEYQGTTYRVMVMEA